jgi:hypothetical protein
VSRAGEPRLATFREDDENVAVRDRGFDQIDHVAVSAFIVVAKENESSRFAAPLRVELAGLEPGDFVGAMSQVIQLVRSRI